jgi:hypothetical protein
MAPLNVIVRGQTARTAQPRTDRQSAPENYPGFTGIAVRELLQHAIMGGIYGLAGKYDRSRARVQMIREQNQ